MSTMTLEQVLDKAARGAIRKALIASGGRSTVAAVALGISYATIKREIVRLGLAEWLRTMYPAPGR